MGIAAVILRMRVTTTLVKSRMWMKSVLISHTKSVKLEIISTLSKKDKVYCQSNITLAILHCCKNFTNYVSLHTCIHIAFSMCSVFQDNSVSTCTIDILRITGNPLKCTYNLQGSHFHPLTFILTFLRVNYE